MIQNHLKAFPVILTNVETTNILPDLVFFTKKIFPTKTDNVAFVLIKLSRHPSTSKLLY